MKKLLSIIITGFAIALGANGASYTTAQRLALALGPSDAGTAVWDSDLNAQFWWRGTEWVGFPVGFPVIPGLSTNRIGVVAGSIQQRSSARQYWDYGNATDQATVGVSGTYATASGYDITITFAKTYKQVISFIVSPDASFANVAGLSVGASVGLSSAIIRANSLFNAAFVVYYDGSNWVVGSGAGQSISPSASYAAGVLTITHAFCQGTGASATAWTRSGAITNPYLPVFESLSSTSMSLRFMDTNAVVVTGSANTRMSAAITKVNSGGWPADGTSSATSLNGLDPATAKLYFLGLFIE